MRRHRNNDFDSSDARIRHYRPYLCAFIPAKVAGEGKQQANEHTTSATTTTITEREQSARSALQEIELDYQLGNISEEDYNTLRERYVRRALVALKARQDNKRDGQDTVETPYDRDKELDDLIEEQLRALKEKDATD